ncbi:MAG: PAS domain-containing protein [Casimicrobiaceae bacterium]
MTALPAPPRFPSALTLLFVLCLGLTAVGGVALVLASSALTESTRALERDLNVKQTLESLLVALVNAEAGQRGYLLTGQSQLLQPYVEAVAKQAYYLGSLEQLAAHDPRQQGAIRALKPLVDASLRQLSSSLAASPGTRPATPLESLNRTSALMNNVRAAIESLRQLQDASLAQRRAEVERRTRYATLILLVANAASLLGIAILYAAMRRYHRRRQAVQDEIAQREEEYRTLFEASPLGEAECDPQSSRFLRTNAKLAEITGHTSESLRRATIVDLLPRANRLDNARAYRELIAGERDVLRLEQPLLRADGTVTWAEIHLGAVRRADGTVARVDAIVQDITARRQAEEARSGSLAVLQAIAVGNRNLVFAKDLQGRYVFANVALVGALEQSEDDILGARDEDLFPAECAVVMRATDRLVLETRAAQTTEQTLHFARETRVYLVTASPFVDAMGEVAGIVGIGTDITERKRDEGALRSAFAAAEERVAQGSTEARQAVESERTRMALELHDELGAAFSAVWVELVGVLTQLKKLQPQLTLRQERALNALTQASESVRRITAGLHPILLEQAGLAAALGRYVSEWGITTGVRADFHADNALPTLNGEEELALFRIAQEALNNVHKYAAATHVTVSLHPTRDGLRLTVRDDGVGIADPFCDAAGDGGGSRDGELRTQAIGRHAAGRMRGAHGRPAGGAGRHADGTDGYDDGADGYNDGVGGHADRANDGHDDGAGKHADGIARPNGGVSTGHGIAGMRARLRPLGGILWIGRRGDAGGTDLTVRLPVPRVRS